MATRPTVCISPHPAHSKGAEKSQRSASVNDSGGSLVAPQALVFSDSPYVQRLALRLRVSHDMLYQGPIHYPHTDTLRLTAWLIV